MAVRVTQLRDKHGRRRLAHCAGVNIKDAKGGEVNQKLSEYFESSRIKEEDETPVQNIRNMKKIVKLITVWIVISLVFLGYVLWVSSTAAKNALMIGARGNETQELIDTIKRAEANLIASIKELKL